MVRVLPARSGSTCAQTMSGVRNHMTTPLTSIIILTFNELEYTRACVESIYRHTPEPFELIFVDNGSTDGTRDYLATLDALCIFNDRNMGFGGGCNQGIAAARGERILLLNNDTVVTPGWLDAMHRALDSDPTRGIVGPRSNRIIGVQQLDSVSYDEESLDGLDAFAREHTRTHADQGRSFSRLIGFCMLMRREVVTEIGGFDVGFELGNFEDDDVCLRAGVAGWSCWICDDSFVHHFGSRTFIGAGISHSASMQSNGRRFAAKWGITISNNSYDPAAVVRETRFDSRRHYAPIVAAPSDDAQIEVGGQRTRMLFAADPLFPAATAQDLRLVVDALRGSVDTTLVVRIDPADTTTLPALEAAADHIPDAELCDIVLVHRSAANDEAVVRACDTVLVHGVRGHVMSGLAGYVGRESVTVDDLSNRHEYRAAA